MTLHRPGAEPLRKSGDEMRLRNGSQPPILLPKPDISTPEGPAVVRLGPSDLHFQWG